MGDRGEAERRQRAAEQRILLLTTVEDPDHPSTRKFHILGSTGTRYWVTGCAELDEWKCTCRDFTFRHQKCKHIFFVEDRVLRSNLPPLSGSSKEAKPPPREVDTQQECPICFEVLIEEGVSLDHCPHCRNSFHLPCLTRWLRSKTNNSHSCPLCRKILKN